MNTISFKTFKSFMETVNEIITEKDDSIVSIFEANDYPQYGWYQGVFMTDKFGGIAVIIKNINGNWFYNDSPVTFDFIMKDCLDKDIIYNDVKKVYEERNMSEIYELINDEY